MPMNDLIDLQKISGILSKLEVQLFKHVFTVISLQQLVAGVMIMALAWVLSKKLSSWLNIKSETWNGHYVSMIKSRIYLSSQEILLLVLTPLILWVGVLIAKSANWPYGILNGAASLVSAWAAIRLGSSVIKSEFWSKTLAFSIWTIAALNILGWLEPTIIVLDKAAIPLGKTNLSLLLLLKGAILFALLLWIAGITSEAIERALLRSKLSPSQKVLLHKLSKIFFISTAGIIALNVVGLDFTALAVFSGALGIGIGFGLQKVFANLMSGFILLMDKSIKPGDVIAIADTYGWVNRLGARYVSILTRDGKEHLIPNETLITERVENWSYSSDRIRIHTPIGVSYDSDIVLVKKLLLEVAAKHPRILKKPEPACLIKGFGDNSVDFEIRAWIKDPVNGISNVKSDLYEEIWLAFQQNDVEIPFPQRDLNVNMKQVHKILEIIKNDQK